MKKDCVSYSDKLKDPRWQKKMLEVLEASGWECSSCGAKTKELQVHHYACEHGKDPWEYDADVLVVLCKDCHKDSSEKMSELSRMINSCSAVYGDITDELIGYVKGVGVELLRDERLSDEEVSGFSKATRIPEEFIQKTTAPNRSGRQFWLEMIACGAYERWRQKHVR